MSKEYGTKLTLKDNFSTVIQKAISATEALKNKLESTEKALNKLGDKKVKIKAELDSSVNSSLNKLGDKIPKDKTIHIKAKDEVTRSVTNIKRDIFKMGNDISMGMRDPFRGFSRSAISATSNIGMMRSAAQELVRSMATSHVAAQMAGNFMAASAAAGVAASRMTGSRTNSGIRPTVFYSASRRSGLTQSGHPDPDFYESQERYHRLGRGDVPPRFNRESRSMTYFDSDRADMIARQKQVMKNRYGNRNYLSSHTVGDEHIGGGDFLRTTNRMLGPVGFAYQSAKENVSNKMASANVRVRAITSSAEASIRAFGTRVSNSKLGEIGMRMKFAGERGLYDVQGAISRVSSAFGRIRSASSTASSATSSSVASMGFDLQRFASGAGAAASSTAGGMARVRAAMASVGTSIRGFAGRSVTFTVNAITSGAKAAIAGLMSAIKGLSIAAGAIVIGGATMGIKGAMEMEQNIISIEHFVKYANTKNFSKGKESKKTDAEIQTNTADYLKKMRKYAVDTPFGDTEVIAAGRRAVNVMNGDLKDAEDLVHIAGDMAALNPGKTIMQAMEALADMKTGEMERMKEFGLKISAKQFKALVGKKEKDDLTDEEQTKAYRILMDHKLKTMFGGGAKKLSNTASGKWSTLTGTISSGLADVGTMFLPGIKTGLDKAIAMINNVGPRFIAAFQPMADRFNKLMSGEGGGGGKFVVMFQQIATSMQPAIQAFTTLFAKVDFMKYFANVVAVAGSAIKLVMEMLGPVFNVAGVIIADVMTFVAGHIVDVQNIFKDLSMIWASSWPVLSNILLGAWGVIKPALEALWNIAMVIVDVFTLSWPLISGAVQVLWAVVSPIFSALSALLEGIAWAAGKAHQALQWVIDKKAQLGGSTDINLNSSGASERAVGMEYIPYNGYKISAHRGEAILTRTEADQWRAGKSGGVSGVVINIHDPVVREEADLHRLGTRLAQALSETRSNMGAVPA